ncbi:L-lactate permease [Rhodospirillum centenum]|uniref:L-lactate permease n=1 Tax=Rhodospirillum centenum (strain ATCC 51521 / SW) TaxID=414684 RepID=B6IWJ0_RHOCS|nr:L-lactate permease [Rhodospirillum centenum]ACJ00664.1 L-lactate permease, putative [Rhodospirillum centenum SW]
MLPLLALSPILLILVLMVVFRRPAATAAGVGLALGVVVALALFEVAVPLPDAGDGASALSTSVAAGLGGVALEAAFLAATILWIIFPALCLHELQTATGAVDRIRASLTGLSGDPRLLAILLGWFFALFIEGAAGFGTPAALTAPMLVAVGFAPVQAVTLALVGHSIGVSFGAVGTPVLPQIAVTPFSGPELAQAVAVLHGMSGWVMLLFLVRYARVTEGPLAAGMTGRTVLPWAALAAVLFVVPYLALAFAVGPELPTLGGALVGGLLFVLILRRSGDGRRAAAPVPAVPAAAGAVSGRGLLWAGLPYLAVLALILATRLVPPVQEALRAVVVDWTMTGGFSGRVEPLYHPGTMLLAGFLLGGLAQGVGVGTLAGAMRRAAARLPTVALALLAMLALARLMVHSGMITTLADAAAAGLGPVWPLLAPLVGILGAFVTGSATASNILFTDFQQATAQTLGLPVLPLLGSQNFGAAVGNIICPHNIIAACALVGIAGREGEVLRRTLLPCAVYALLGGALTWAFAALG